MPEGNSELTAASVLDQRSVTETAAAERRLQEATHEHSQSNGQQLDLQQQRDFLTFVTQRIVQNPQQCREWLDANSAGKLL